MTRVYLFADVGKGPRVLSDAIRAPRSDTRRVPMTFGTTVEGGNHWWISHAACERYLRARAWWLVECENAEAGRHAIRCNGTTACDGAGPFGCDGPDGVCPFGRILASGTNGGAR